MNKEAHWASYLESKFCDFKETYLGRLNWQETHFTQKSQDKRHEQQYFGETANIRKCESLNS